MILTGKSIAILLWQSIDINIAINLRAILGIASEELLQGKKIDMPPTTREFLPKAPRISKPQGEQIALEEQSL